MVTWIAFCEKVEHHGHFSLVRGAMFKLDFKYSPMNLKRERKLDWSKVSPSEFSYDFTRGRIEIFADDQCLSERWGDIPVLDFSACLLVISDRLWKAGGKEVFEFTEGEGEIRLCRQGSSVTAEIDYGGLPRQTFSVGIAGFRDEVRRFAQSVLADSITRHPEILKNKEFREWHPLGGTLR